MYEAFFGLLQRPFAAVPSVQNYFAAEAIEQSRRTLIRTIERAEGVGLIIGPAGTGKTLLCQLLADHFKNDYRVVLLNSARICTRRALLQNILFELRLPFRDMEEGELRLSLIDHLEPSEECPNGMLLVIDEAHTLPLRILEEVRLITNLVRDGLPRVRLVLSGSAHLEERLASPRLESFNQRIASRCYLHSFTQQETAQYVQHQVHLAGGKAETIFADDAYRALYLATDGIPRLLNQVCDHVLMLAYAGGRRSINARGIEEAWADLQRLPAPWAVDTQPAEGIIEFGELDAADADADEDADDELFATRGVEEIDSRENADLIEITAAGAAEVAIVEISSQIDALNSLPEVSTQGASEKEREAKKRSAPSAWRAEDPFGGTFSDEEIVLDQFDSWDNAPLVSAARVTSSESQEIAAALTAAETARKQTATVVLEGEPARRDSSAQGKEPSLASDVQTIATIVSEEMADKILTVESLTSQAASDYAAPMQCVLSEPVDYSALAARVAEEAPHAPSLPVPHYFPLPETDDRDIIVLEDDHGPQLAIAGRTPRATRQEYRRLFGQLRRN